MKTLVWLTDIHLDFVTDAKIDSFVQSINDSGCDGVLIGGDIGTAMAKRKCFRTLRC